MTLPMQASCRIGASCSTQLHYLQWNEFSKIASLSMWRHLPATRLPAKTGQRRPGIFAKLAQQLRCAQTTVTLRHGIVWLWRLAHTLAMAGMHWHFPSMFGSICTMRCWRLGIMHPSLKSSTARSNWQNCLGMHGGCREATAISPCRCGGSPTILVLSSSRPAPFRLLKICKGPGWKVSRW